MKRLILLAAAAAAGAVALQQRVKAQRAEADLWAQLTDEAPRASTSLSTPRSTPASPVSPAAGQGTVSG